MFRKREEVLEQLRSAESVKLGDYVLAEILLDIRDLLQDKEEVKECEDGKHIFGSEKPYTVCLECKKDFAAIPPLPEKIGKYWTIEKIIDNQNVIIDYLSHLKK